MKYNTIFVNGRAFNCSELMSLEDLLIYLNFNVDLIAVEYNKKVLTHDGFKNVLLNHQDHIEIITIVGGG